MVTSSAASGHGKPLSVDSLAEVLYGLRHSIGSGIYCICRCLCRPVGGRRGCTRGHVSNTPRRFSYLVRHPLNLGTAAHLAGPVLHLLVRTSTSA